MLDVPGSGASGEADERVPGLRQSLTSLMPFAGSADLFRYRVWGTPAFLQACSRAGPPHALDGTGRYRTLSGLKLIA